jgi:hypothetical protein
MTTSRGRPADMVYVAAAALSGVPIEDVVGAAVEGAVVTVDWGNEQQTFDLPAIFAGLR